jgi:hypothetical protein
VREESSSIGGSFVPDPARRSPHLSGGRVQPQLLSSTPSSQCRAETHVGQRAPTFNLQPSNSNVANPIPQLRRSVSGNRQCPRKNLHRIAFPYLCSFPTPTVHRPVSRDRCGQFFAQQPLPPPFTLSGSSLLPSKQKRRRNPNVCPVCSTNCSKRVLETKPPYRDRKDSVISNPTDSISCLAGQSTHTHTHMSATGPRLTPRAPGLP